MDTYDEEREADLAEVTAKHREESRKGRAERARELSQETSLQRQNRQEALLDVKASTEAADAAVKKREKAEADQAAYKQVCDMLAQTVHNNALAIRATTTPTTPSNTLVTDPNNALATTTSTDPSSQAASTEAHKRSASEAGLDEAGA